MRAYISAKAGAWQTWGGISDWTRGPVLEWYFPELLNVVAEGPKDDGLSPLAQGRPTLLKITSGSVADEDVPPARRCLGGVYYSQKGWYRGSHLCGELGHGIDLVVASIR